MDFLTESLKGIIMKKMLHIGSGCLLTIFFLFGCTKPPYHIQTPFSEEELAPYAKKGTGIVVGQAFLKTRAGDVKYGAGEDIFLIPVTNYTTEIVTAIMANSYSKADNSDPRLNKYKKITKANGEGRFQFQNVPPGNYYVCATITWEVPGPYSSSHKTGGHISQTITVKDGEKVEVVLTR